MGLTWYPNGKLHRLVLMNDASEFHCDDGPALICYYDTGDLKLKKWYVNGVSHCDYGPAEIAYRIDGSVMYEEYFLHGQIVEKEEFIAYRRAMIIDEIINL